MPDGNHAYRNKNRFRTTKFEKRNTPKMLEPWYDIPQQKEYINTNKKQQRTHRRTGKGSDNRAGFTGIVRAFNFVHGRFNFGIFDGIDNIFRVVRAGIFDGGRHGRIQFAHIFFGFQIGPDVDKRYRQGGFFLMHPGNAITGGP